MITSQWPPYREPLRTTLLRTVIIALVIGAILAFSSNGLSQRALTRWPITTLLALWPSLGGHCVELFFLNWLRPRLSSARHVQVPARIAVWLLAGAAIALAMWLTAMTLGLQPTHRTPSKSPSEYTLHLSTLGAIAFIAIELIVHAVLQLRNRPNFYNGRG